jgi:hypothetical protein
VPERPKSAALPAKAPPEPPKPAKSSPDLKETIAARIAASAKLKPPARPPLRNDTPAPPRKPAPPPVERGDAIESSILAAIAEAVDVLVEDGGADKAEARSAPPQRDTRQIAARRPPPDHPPPQEPPAPEAAEEVEEGSGDIGDEIQRIVASYNRDRNDKPR